MPKLSRTVMRKILGTVIARRPEVIQNLAPLPSSVRYAGLASISIWGLVIVCGRLLAYLPD